MKKLKKLKLNEAVLEKKQMKKLLGGTYKCGCGCGEIDGQTNAGCSCDSVYNIN